MAKLIGGTKSHDKLLRNGSCLIDKSINAYEGDIYVHDEDTIVCYFCGKVGHMTSKCKDRPRMGVSNAFKTNKRGPKKMWVPKEKIIPIANVFDSKKQMSIMVLKEWLLMTYDKRKVYVPIPKSLSWWNRHFQKE